MSDVIARADAFAAGAHAAIDQRRKWTNEPYIVHPRAVARIVRSATDDEETIAAALLHDVVEDTKVRHQDLIAEFGINISYLVFWLTDTPPFEGNRAWRKTRDRNRLAKAPREAQTIKVADLIQNTETIVAHDPAFARVYLQEKAALLDVLTLAYPALLQRAQDQLGCAALEINAAP